MITVRFPTVEKPMQMQCRMIYLTRGQCLILLYVIVSCPALTTECFSAKRNIVHNIGDLSFFIQIWVSKTEGRLIISAPLQISIRRAFKFRVEYYVCSSRYVLLPTYYRTDYVGSADFYRVDRIFLT